ncbi:MAG TPA: zinc ribbon domain-containing protein [Pyrinomonadaceae bacterium]|jgi:hypothetical protein
MQPTVACTSCGAEIPVEARFCRNCGQPAAQSNRESVTEGTTRLLETSERPPAPPPAQGVYEHPPGGLAQPTNRLPSEANPTARALEPNRKPTNWVLIGAIVVAALALIVTGLVIGLRKRPAAAAATPATPPIVRTGPGTIQPPIPPPQAPQPPPTATEGVGISPALIYPGAKTVMKVTGNPDGSGNVLQLQTSDSFDKVVRWYKEKLKPQQTIEQEESVIFTMDDVTAIITKQGDSTGIMLTDEKH